MKKLVASELYIKNSCLVRLTWTERSSPDIDNCKNMSDFWSDCSNCLSSSLIFIHPSHVPEISPFLIFFQSWSVPDVPFICKLTYWLGSWNQGVYFIIVLCWLLREVYGFWFSLNRIWPVLKKGYNFWVVFSFKIY